MACSRVTFTLPFSVFPHVGSRYSSVISVGQTFVWDLSFIPPPWVTVFRDVTSCRFAGGAIITEQTSVSVYRADVVTIFVVSTGWETPRLLLRENSRCLNCSRVHFNVSSPPRYGVCFETLTQAPEFETLWGPGVQQSGRRADTV